MIRRIKLRGRLSAFSCPPPGRLYRSLFMICCVKNSQVNHPIASIGERRYQPRGRFSSVHLIQLFAPVKSIVSECVTLILTTTQWWLFRTKGRDGQNGVWYDYAA